MISLCLTIKRPRIKFNRYLLRAPTWKNLKSILSDDAVVRADQLRPPIRAVGLYVGGCRQP